MENKKLHYKNIQERTQRFLLLNGASFDVLVYSITTFAFQIYNIFQKTK